MSKKNINLDSVFETAGLLYISSHFDKVKHDIKTSLKELGLDGEQYYSQNLNFFDKYIESFTKYRVLIDGSDFFLGETDFNYFLILLSLIIENKNWLSSMDDLTPEYVNKQIIHICEEAFDNSSQTDNITTLDNIVNYLDKIGFEASVNWRLLHIMLSPLKYLSQFANLINANINAFYKAIDENKKNIKIVLDQYDLAVIKQTDNFIKIKDKLSKSSNIYPTLVFPISQMIFENNYYDGVLSRKVLKNEKGFSYTKDVLLRKIKALGDSSKMEILLSLKECPKYNLEIAQQLGLSAATMSHHMNVLLNCGLVFFEKRDGRVYYHIETECIKEMISDLEMIFL